MGIMVTLSDVMSDRGILCKDLADRIGIHFVNLSRIRTGRIEAMRFSTLDALCRELGCQPGDILKYVPDGKRSRSDSHARR